MSLPDEVIKYAKVAGDFGEFLKYCKLEDSATNDTISFVFWPHLQELVKVFKRERYVVILKAKQVGISYMLAFYALWKVLTVKNFRVLILSSSGDASVVLLNKIKDAWKLLPLWLAVPYDKWNETEVSFPSMGSSIVAFASTEYPSVGETASLVIMDEEDFHRFPLSDWSAAAPTASAGGQIMMVSTRLKKTGESLFYRTYTQAKEKLNNFYPIFIGVLARPDRDMDWYERERRNYIGEEWAHDENNPLTEEQALSPIIGEGYFNGERLKVMLDNSSAPMEVRQDFISIYSLFDGTVAYGIGADISQGIGGDYQAAILLGKRGLKTEDIAVIHNNKLRPETFAFHSANLAHEYNDPIIGAEANAVGISYLNPLDNLEYHNIYMRDQDKTHPKMGWWTSGEKKELMLIELAQAIEKGDIVIRHKPTINQLFQFIRGNNGKPVSIGAHDDLVMALAIAYQMLKEVPDYVKPIRNFSLLQEQRTECIC